mmetsp:Transcript_13364/g.20263  ORF Transcript_13364/g.20263 Transcript_13364/m.20263 type:complete len:136 (+) Transcript_13364:2-409(+)
MKIPAGFIPSTSDWVAAAFINLLMAFFSIWVVSATRASIRAKYYIPEYQCYDVEDVMCATFCMPCTICQMGRHTADYDTYVGLCCSRTGMPGHVELPPTPKLKPQNSPVTQQQIQQLQQQQKTTNNHPNVDAYVI